MAGVLMNRLVVGATLGVLALALAAAAPPARGSREPGAAMAAPLSAPEVEAGVRLSADAANRFQAQLLAALEQAMAKGGVEGAVAVCARQAPAIAGAVSAQSGATVRRTALRTRNPKAQPDPFERAVLGRWLGAPVDAAGKPQAYHAILTGPDGHETLRYMRAIPLRGQCLACHGDPAEMSDALRQAIARRYPADRAVGFAEGELRGAFSVSWTAPALRTALAREAAGTER